MAFIPSSLRPQARQVLLPTVSWAGRLGQNIRLEANQMAIRFTMPMPAEEHVAFAYSPLLEAVLSLHVLAEPKHHPAQHRWVRLAARFPAGLKRQIDALGFVFRSYIPEFVFPGAGGGFPAFEAELGQLDSLPTELVALEFSRPLRGGTASRDPAALSDKRVREEITVAAAALTRPARQLALLLLDDPVRLLQRFQALLHDYWEHAFEAEWSRIEDSLADAVSAAGHDIAARGVRAALRGVSAELRVSQADDAVSLSLARPHDHQLRLSPGQRLVLVPSWYVWPHVRANCDPPWPFGLVYPAPAVREEGQVQIPPGELLRVLRALADDTRLRLLSLAAQQPRSTQELAPLLHISQATCSKHLRVLAEAGLLHGRRDGYYVLYSLDRTRLAQLQPSITGFLTGDGGVRGQ
jgi:DNA-binding transcriptional ArsR family regulator